jgi:glycosyltransferase involved in cell wall biosynthesis
MTFADLTIVTSCVNYAKYLDEWATSILKQTVRPGAVCIFTHGTHEDKLRGGTVSLRLSDAGIPTRHQHSIEKLDLGSARNRAVEMAKTEWVQHLDADDTLTSWAVEEFQRLAPFADMTQAGYIRTGQISLGPSKRARLYTSADGERALDLPSMASGCSPFRKSFWMQSPYRTDMLGGWDTALWIGFAKLGARFRPTTREVFHYRQHADSVFNIRRKTLGWARVHTTAMLKQVRSDRSGVDVIVPRDLRATPDRDIVWKRVRAHYETHHPDWRIIEGRCATPVWIQGAAINDALKQSNADIIILADADCLVDPNALQCAVTDVSYGKAWAMPHLMVYRATKEMTEQYVADNNAITMPLFPDRHSTERPVYEGAPGGGIVVLRRMHYDAIGGIPLAFRGWGSEDRALACLCLGLLGPCARGTADLLHLWHVPQADRAQPNGNLQLLRKLGQSALHSKDALVSCAYTMPNPGNRPLRKDDPWKKNVGTARPVPTPIDVDKIAKRHAILRQRRTR